MKNRCDLTEGSVLKNLLSFSMPYLLAALMQTIYGIVDLYVVGRYNTSSAVSAVTIGSQVMHMVTVIILGFAMGSTVRIAHYVGEKNEKKAAQAVGCSVVIFVVIAFAATVVLALLTSPILNALQTPPEALSEAKDYLRICFFGVPFIVAYNVISAIFRGTGDSRSPMVFVTIACVVNVILDFVLVGGYNMGPAGAAYATIIAQALSSFLALMVIIRRGFHFPITKDDFRIRKNVIRDILGVGTPVALQDGFIQVAFLVVTAIANSRGVIASASVGIVEKIISFVFLVNSSMLSSISAITAQNEGAGKLKRANETLTYGLMVVLIWGALLTVYCQFLPGTLVWIFSKDPQVIAAGSDYLRSYIFDTMFAGIHFCFSGYFCGRGKSIITFIHNICSITLIRIPGCYLASKWWPDTLYPMGWAIPLGSMLSCLICLVFFIYLYRKDKANNMI